MRNTVDGPLSIALRRSSSSSSVHARRSRGCAASSWEYMVMVVVVVAAAAADAEAGWEGQGKLTGCWRGGGSCSSTGFAFHSAHDSSEGTLGMSIISPCAG